ncbi:hypothetical protein NQ317_012444 [Molorchus minor]|uniref:Uncharacterized protein n=1 Tax=Molorchus minor TaxID=1323400 RepID=A0ABQ9J389_9CUCU|nr:hypothetical protein NQ317_012444 [Molorchus minor]
MMENIIKLMVIILLVAALTKKVMDIFGHVSDDQEHVVPNQSEIIINANITDNIGAVVSVKENVIRKKGNSRINVSKQPSCQKSYIIIILREICSELYTKKELCTPKDYYSRDETKRRDSKFKSNSPKEVQVPAIVNYAIGGLLIASVAAALLELYKAKRPKIAEKNPTSRKCSLADLVVMKHHRKELLRRESILELPEENVLAKQMGFTNRRCSLPVESRASNHRTTLVSRMAMDSVRNNSVSEIWSANTERRPHTILEGKFGSADDGIDMRRISLDGSPERRPHRLVVHRH